MEVSFNTLRDNYWRQSFAIYDNFSTPCKYSTKTSKQQILSLDVFKTYKATVLDESTTQQNVQQSNNQPSSSGGSCCGSGSCECGCGRR